MSTQKPKYLWSSSRNCNWIIEILPKNVKWNQRIHWKSGTTYPISHVRVFCTIRYVYIAHCFHIYCTQWSYSKYRMYERHQSDFISKNLVYWIYEHFLQMFVVWQSCFSSHLSVSVSVCVELSLKGNHMQFKPSIWEIIFNCKWNQACAMELHMCALKRTICSNK